MKYNETKDIVIFSDLDGTLLDENSNISKANINAIERYVSAGGKFAIATGRSIESAQQWIDLLPINFPCIFYNGSVIYNPKKDKLVKMSLMSKDKVINVIEKVYTHYSDLCIQLFYEDEIICLIKGECIDVEHLFEENSKIIDDIDSILEKDLLKILIYKKNIKDLNLDEFLCDDIKNCEIKAFYSSHQYFEIIPFNTSKGQSINLLKEKYNLIVAAIGDEGNDLEMLNNADFSFCPINAVTQCKEKADYIVSSNNEDAIKEMINILLVKEVI